MVRTSLESSLQDLSSDTWFSTDVSESSGQKNPEKGSNDIELSGDLLEPAKYLCAHVKHNTQPRAFRVDDG